MITKLTLDRDELARLVELCDKFDVATVVVARNDAGGGIGYTLDAEVAVVVNGISGTFTVPVTDVTHW